MESNNNAHRKKVDEVSVLMKDLQKGVEIKDRKWYFRTYKDCFVGKEANFTSREDAVRLGNVMVARKIFHHVTRDHDFKDDMLYYRFEEDEEKIHRGSLPEDISGWTDFLPKSSILRTANQNSLQPTMMKRSESFDTFEAPPELKDLLVSPLDEWNIQLLDNVHPPKWLNPVPSDTYNMIVIGAGSGGLVTAAACAGLGAKVALIERHLLGGDCLNVGCVPSKALLRSAHAVAAVRDAALYGVKVNEFSVDFPAIMERMRKLRATMSAHDSAKRFADELGVDVYIGHAAFSSKHSITVGDQTLKFSKACIATGARPAVPPIPGLSEATYLTNVSIFNLAELPPRLGVIGAGPVGCELAQCFARFGSKVTMLVRGNCLLSREDPEASALLYKVFTNEDGINVLFNVKFLGVELRDKHKVVKIQIHDKQEEVFVDEILIATGRKPNVEGLGLDAAEIKYDRHGVTVNDTLQTTNPNVFAVGDVCTQFRFTHVSDAMARIVVRNALFFGSSKFSDLIIPWATYTQPEVAHVGLYEQDIKSRGIKYVTFKKSLENNDRAILEGATEGFVKIHVKEGTDEILGASIVASHAGEMISEISVVMNANFGLGKLASVLHPYPTQTDAVRSLGDEYNRTRLTTTVKILFRKLMAARR